MSILKNNRPQKPFRFNGVSDINGEITTKNIKNLIGESSDVKFLTVKTGKDRSLTVTFIFIDGMVNTPVVDENILEPLQSNPNVQKVTSQKELLEGILCGMIPHNSLKKCKDLQECIEGILFGFGVIVFDEEKQAIMFDVKGFEKRSVPESANENVVKGGRDAFIEIIRTNTALVRTRLQSDKLRIIENSQGNESKTQVAVVYLDGVADPAIVNAVLDKVKSFHGENMITSTLVEDHIAEKKMSIFPRLLYTERPDKFAANISRGKVGLIINGLPTAYILPATFDMFMQAAEDYSYNIVVAQAIRVIRYIALFIALVLPSYYIALTAFNPEMIPRELAIALIKSKESVPFSSTVEALFLLFVFELLIEASMRMPKAIGTTLSILGAIVIGDAAVNAKFISAAVIVVIAMSGIAGFAIPNQDFSNAIRISRVLLLIATSLFGFFGLFFALMLLLHSLAKSESFGMSYLLKDSQSRINPEETKKLINIPIPLKRRVKD